MKSLIVISLYDCVVGGVWQKFLSTAWAGDFWRGTLQGSGGVDAATSRVETLASSVENREVEISVRDFQLYTQQQFLHLWNKNINISSTVLIGGKENIGHKTREKLLLYNHFNLLHINIAHINSSYAKMATSHQETMNCILKTAIGIGHLRCRAAVLHGVYFVGLLPFVKYRAVEP